MFHIEIFRLWDPKGQQDVVSWVDNRGSSITCVQKKAINTNWCIKKESLTMDVCSKRPICNTKHDIYAKE